MIRINSKNDNKYKTQATKTNSNLDILDFNLIYSNIVPYLEKPEFIKKVLNKLKNKSHNKIIEMIESEIRQSDQIHQTDLRILLNMIEKQKN